MKQNNEILFGCFIYIAILTLTFIFVGLMYVLSMVNGVTTMKYVDLGIFIVSLLIIFVNQDSNPKDGWKFVWLLLGITLFSGAAVAAGMLGSM